MDNFLKCKYEMAKVLYNNLLDLCEEFLDDKEFELYILTSLHTGLRCSDLLELNWNQLVIDGENAYFKDVKINKLSSQTKKEVRANVSIQECDSYLNILTDDISLIPKEGKMFLNLDKLKISKMLKDISCIQLNAFDLRKIHNILFVYDLEKEM